MYRFVLILFVTIPFTFTRKPLRTIPALQSEVHGMLREIVRPHAVSIVRIQCDGRTPASAPSSPPTAGCSPGTRSDR